MMLIDKSYYDYDFKKVSPKQKYILFEDTVKDTAQTQQLLAKFGIGVLKKDPKMMNMEELQEYAINDINKK